MSLNKTRLSAIIAVQADLPKNRSAKAVATIIDTLTHALAAGQEARIPGFGKFYVQTLSEHIGRHPKTGDSLRIKARRTVRFRCFKQLRQKLNRRATTAYAIPSGPSAVQERRREPRMDALPQGIAVVRISGIAVCDFKVRDVSGNGSCILVEDDSVVLRNLRVGREIELHMAYTDRPHKAVLQRSRITHITRPPESDAYHGHIMVGVQIIDTLSIH